MESSQLLHSFLNSPLKKTDAVFSATNTAQSLISAQMKKAADRTFNHSLEFATPARQEVGKTMWFMN